MRTNAWRLVFLVSLLALAAVPTAHARTTPVCFLDLSTPGYPDLIDDEPMFPSQMQISKMSRGGRQLLSSADRSAIAVAEKLEDSAGSLGAKALVAGSPASPDLSSPLPPPSPPSCTRTPIEAYCFPFWENSEKRQGCLAKVAKADPGSDVWFKVQSATGEWIRSFVKLEKNATYGHKFLYLEDSSISRRIQPSFTGKVVYKEEFDCSWPVLSTDPSAETTDMGWHLLYGQLYMGNMFRTRVPVGNGQFVTIDSYKKVDFY